MADAWDERREEVRKPGAQIARGARRQRPAQAVRPSRSTEQRARRPVPACAQLYDRANGGFGARAEVPDGLAARVPARRAASARCRSTRCARWPPAASTTRSAAALPATRSTRPGPCRTSRRCSTTTPCWPAPTCTAGRCQASRAAARLHETLDWALREMRAPRAASVRRSTPTPRASRASSTSGRRRAARARSAPSCPRTRSPTSAPPSAATSRTACVLEARGPEPASCPRSAASSTAHARSAYGPGSTTSS